MYAKHNTPETTKDATLRGSIHWKNKHSSIQTTFLLIIFYFILSASWLHLITDQPRVTIQNRPRIFYYSYMAIKWGGPLKETAENRSRFTEGVVWKRPPLLKGCNYLAKAYVLQSSSGNVYVYIQIQFFRVGQSTHNPSPHH